MKLSIINKVISMKCDEELLSYLGHVRTIWRKILGGSTVAVDKIDTETVQAVELTCPRYSSADRRRLRLLLEKGQIFRGLGHQEREGVWGNLMSIDCIVPSLRSFFEDAMYLWPCANNIRHVIGLYGRSETIYHALQQCFRQEDDEHGSRLIVENGEAVFDTRPAPSTPGELCSLGRRQLWLYAMRHLAQVAAPLTSSEEWRVANVGPERADESVLCGFASLAYRLGFRNDHILDFQQRSPDGRWRVRFCYRHGNMACMSMMVILSSRTSTRSRR
ncbi:hypothetical protein BKA67DRAFT_117672 [Truncatella angustata]|uniref:Uncharacterized protein n=1 Tax=Truncatella angustata TaxID=152316 RepID=A0A9P8RGW7_9PEZI|nr:uncharacterized protein BKA67DRAFT_117672 [Truncatella angustata]KAH6645569.1 hypothetical protein BKA67DRAFT_117672 [Truncatella angustata]